MEKRLPLALILSFLVLMAWSLFVKPPAKPEEGLEGQELPDGAVATTALDEAGRVDESGAAAPAEELAPASTFTPSGEVVRAGEEREIELIFGTPGKRGSYFAVFTNRGALLRELRLGDWYVREGLTKEERRDPANWAVVVRPAMSGEDLTGSLALRTQASSRRLASPEESLDEALWVARVLGSADEPNGVEFEYAAGTGARFRKRILAQPNSYELLVEIEIENEGTAVSGPVQFELTPAEVVPQEVGDRFYIEPQAIAAGRAEPDDALAVRVSKRSGNGSLREPDAFRVGTSPLAFAGVENKYFALVLRADPTDPPSVASLRGASWRDTWDGEYARDEGTDKAWMFPVADLQVGTTMPVPGETRTLHYRAYAGPKKPAELEAVSEDLLGLVHGDLKAFLPGVESIAKLLLVVLRGVQSLVGNWGVAIILLTFGMRALLFPLNRRSQTAMARYTKKMKRLQPQIDELKKRYEKDPTKLRKAQGELMQKEGAMPPLGGCLPMFLQIPVFFGLFTALRTSIDLRQAPFFGWITDLSRPDRLMKIDLDTHLPFLGTIEYLNVLPPIMMALMLLQQRFMPKPADEQAARMQKMMMFMPIVFGVFLYNYAAGLSLYMITSSTLGMFEMTVIKKKWPIDDTEVARKPGFMARLAEKQLEQQKRMAAQRGGGKGKGGKGGKGPGPRGGSKRRQTSR